MPFNPGVKVVETPEKGASHLEAQETGVSQADAWSRQDKDKGSVERERRVKKLISQRDYDYGKKERIGVNKYGKRITDVREEGRRQVKS